MSDALRECSTCRVNKPTSEFLSRSDTGKVKSRCRSCENDWHRGNYQRSRAEKLASEKAHYSKQDTKEKRKAYRAARKLQDKIWKKNWDLQKSYGIDLNTLDIVIDLQRCHCPICSRYFPKGSRYWHVDHDHRTGKVRGVVCGNCNTMLGHAKDNAETLRRAAEYLEKNG